LTVLRLEDLLKRAVISALALAGAVAPLHAAEETPLPLTDGEVWNAGVDSFRGGDVTNALRLLRPLMLSKTHGARAAELVAKMEHERGNREEAASAAQIALRSNPADGRLQRNFTRASDGLVQYRETKRIEKVLKESQGKDPGSMLMAATKDARALMTEAGTYRTNAAEKAIALADSLSKRAETLADVWILVRQAITQAVTNEEQAATIMAQIESAQAKTKKFAKELSDLDGNAYSTVSDVEHDFTRFLKLTAMPPAAIGEDLACQSNAWLDVEAFNGRSWQQDALDFTRAFRAKFPAWAQAYEQQAQADTNKPPFTAEDQAKISAYATELEKLQIECCEKSLPPKQEQALELIRKIQELLPKDKNGGGQGQGQGQPPPQPQNDKDKQDQDKQNGQNQQQQQKQQPQDEGQNKEEDKKDESAGEEQQKDEKDQELEAILKKAQERNDEHEAEKKARMRKAPLPPNERDW
jgi:hypothetical protein